MQSSGSYHAVIRQSSGSHQAVIMQSSGSHHEVIKQTSVFYILLTPLSKGWHLLPKLFYRCGCLIVSMENFLSMVLDWNIIFSHIVWCSVTVFGIPPGFWKNNTFLSIKKIKCLKYNMTGSSKVSKSDFQGQFLNVAECCRMFVGFAIFANVDFRDTLFSKTRPRICQSN